VADAVNALLESPAELPDQGRALYLGRFRPGIVAATYDDLYDHL
jgi:hypothetical protein